MVLQRICLTVTHDGKKTRKGEKVRKTRGFRCHLGISIFLFFSQRGTKVKEQEEVSWSLAIQAFPGLTKICAEVLLRLDNDVQDFRRLTHRTAN